MPGTYALKKTTDGQFMFNLKAGNGEVILTSERYTAKASAENGIASVRTSPPRSRAAEWAWLWVRDVLADRLPGPRIGVYGSRELPGWAGLSIHGSPLGWLPADFARE